MGRSVHRRMTLIRTTAIAAVLTVGTCLAASQSPAPTAAGIDIDAGTVEGHVSPLLYGQFAEFMYENIKGGLHAELVRNRGFEEPANAVGLSRGWDRYPDDRIDDYGISFAWDGDVAYPNTTRTEGLTDGHSLRVQLRPAIIARHGVYQGRVPVRSGVEYTGYVWARGESFTGTLSVALEADTTGGRIYDEAKLTTEAGSGWTKYPFTLRPRADDPLARLAILFTGEGSVWIDQVSLMPADAVDGVRADVFGAVKGLRPAFLRWPGGNVAQDYHWQWGVGPRDERPTWINLSWNRELEPGDFGTDEYIRFVRNLGTEPSITVNVEGRGATPREAAAWVEYCNGPPTSEYGALRARHGHPEPYRVKYWEIGNEIWGDWVRGHSDAATYVRNFDAYASAMRAVDPGIVLIAVGDNDMAWNRVVLGARERIDYLAVHHYYGHKDMGGDLRNLMARPLKYDRWYGEVATALQQLPPDRRPRLAVNEWGLDLPEAQQYSILGALYGARLMNVFERRGDLVGMSAVSDLVNGWPGGIIQASRHKVFLTPNYRVNRLYATRLGTDRLAIKVDGPTFSSTREGDEVPVLDAVASRSADGRQMFVKIVNTDLDRSLNASIRVRGARLLPSAVVERVVSDSLQAANGFTTPNAVRVTKAPAAAAQRFSMVLPRRSITVLTLQIATSPASE
jgi:alpha-N-arabinofuranosidase